MDNYDLAKKIGDALKRLVAEHGAPNSFGCSEIAAYINGASSMQIGRVVKVTRAYGQSTCGGLDTIADRAELTGRLTYDKGRFVVTGDSTEGATLEGYREYLRKGGTLR